MCLSCFVIIIFFAYQFTYEIIHFFLNDVRKGMSRELYKPKRNIFLFTVTHKEDLYMNFQLYNYIIKSAQDYKRYLNEVKMNIKNNEL